MRRNLVLSLLVTLPGMLFAQKAIDRSRQIDTTGKRDLGDVAKAVFHVMPKPIDITKKKSVFFSLLPVSSSVPGGGTALFTSTVFSFYTGDPKTTYISTVTFAPYLSFHHRVGLRLRSNSWSKDNGWVIQGDTRFLIYPQYTWGLGGQQREFDKFVIHYQYIRFYQSALKRIKPYFYAGAGYNMDYYLDIETDNPNALQKFTGYPYGTSSDRNSFSAGITANLLYDTRNNDLNPLPGSYANVVYRVNMMGLGSNDNWQSLYIDLRKYVSLTSARQQNVLAFWTYYWKTFGSGVPYLNLPSIGWDPFNHSGRGIQQNRYRGKSLLYFETEYRRDIMANGLLGFVVFANVNSVSEPVTNSFSYWHPAAGAGLRIKFSKRSGTNIALDYGFSQGYRAFTVGLGEAF